MRTKGTVPRVCLRCETPFVVCPSHVRAGQDRYCSRACNNASRAVPLADRFWSRIAKGDGCWEWAGLRNARGYGKLSLWPKGMGYSHRVAWEIASGETLTRTDYIGHICDNPPCGRNDQSGWYEVNGILLPRWGHLFKGTQLDNMADAASKGRIVHGVTHYTRASAAD